MGLTSTVCILGCILGCIAALPLENWQPDRTWSPGQQDDFPDDVGLEHLIIPTDQLMSAEASHRRHLLAQELRTPRASPRQRCRLTRGGWCGLFSQQAPLEWKPAPRGSKSCPNDCSYTGNCNHDTGLCDCPAGWGGDDCSVRSPRPCTNGWRMKGNVPRNHTTADGRDRNWMEPGWMSTRCPGVCDDSIAMCYCDGKYSYEPPPPPSAQHPYGSPARKLGRMLGDQCMPKQDYLGRPVIWGNVPWDKVYGENGWCNATAPRQSCHCMLDGYWGESCEKRYEQFCINQCQGHGECVLGFCKCHPGWYGTDCARKVAGQDMDPGVYGQRPWLQAHVAPTPEALPEPPPTPRKRPLIYIYDLPPQYNTQLHQYRLGNDGCTVRKYTPGNNTQVVHHVLYSLEVYLWETLSQSEHRTFDPEAADFFYVPALIGCWAHPVFGAADHPWFWGPSDRRVMHASNLLLDVQRWIQKQFPYWDRRGGKDHIWLTNMDEGACFVPSIITNNSVILTHWGRMDPDHQSNSAYHQDNYSIPVVNEWQPYDWRLNWQGGRCYHPSKDLVIPSYKVPAHFQFSPLSGVPALNRSILFYFKGDVGTTRLPHYSRGIRQKLYLLSKQHNWAAKYNIQIGFPHDLTPGYSQWLASSKYCLVAPGDGWSARMEDAMLHGCVPVIIQDNVHVVFESILDVDQFAVHVTESQVEHLPDILLAIPPDKLLRMQRRIARVWHRYAYSTGRLQSSLMQDMNSNAFERGEQMAEAAVAGTAGRLWIDPNGLRPVKRFPHYDDAFNTIMQWLYARIPFTRG